jgi:hypothetical protein
VSRILSSTLSEQAPIEFSTTPGQKIGDTLLAMLTLLASTPFIYFFSHLPVMLLFPEATDQYISRYALAATLLILPVLALRVPIRWWSIRITPETLLLKSWRRQSIVLQEIRLLNADPAMGHKSGADAPLPLHIETRNGKSYKIFLRSTDAQFCIEYLTAQCNWIAAVDTKGNSILPGDPACRATAKRRIGRIYLYSGVPLLIFGIAVLVALILQANDILSGDDNLAEGLYALTATISCISYGLWAIGKYRKLASM